MSLFLLCSWQNQKQHQQILLKRWSVPGIALAKHSLALNPSLSADSHFLTSASVASSVALFLKCPLSLWSHSASLPSQVITLLRSQKTENIEVTGICGEETDGYQKDLRKKTKRIRIFYRMSWWQSIVVPAICTEHTLKYIHDRIPS